MVQRLSRELLVRAILPTPPSPFARDHHGPWCSSMPMVNTETLSPSSHAGSSFFYLMSSHGLVQYMLPMEKSIKMYEPTVAGVSHTLSRYRVSLTNQSKPYVPCMPTYAHAAVVLQL